MKYTELITETQQPGEYVYHAGHLPDPAQGLRSVLAHGLKPSKTGYAGPGVYFAYDPEGGFYHVSKEDATLFRVRWADLVKLYGVYPQNPNGIQRDNDEIVVPGPVPADMLEVEYFPDEWWDIKSAYRASLGPVDENFNDGRIQGKSRPGRVKRAGASCDGSVTDLRARAKKYSGERAKMYHWCANMKAGKNK